MRILHHNSMFLAFSRAALVLLVVVGLLAVTPASHAQTADGDPPAAESVCDGLVGALWGLCVSYCEAMDCDDAASDASARACASVRDNYAKKADGALPPCIDTDGDGVDNLIDNCPTDWNPDQSDVCGGAPAAS